MKLIIIGTLHAGLTPHNELKEALEQYDIDQLLVEITAEDLAKGRLEKYPDEMIYAYRWAIKNNVRVDGFDSSINVLAEGMTDADNKKVIEEQQKILESKGYGWKDLNKKEITEIFNTKSVKKLIDRTKETQREKKMLQNIKSKLIPEGTIVILTGAGHLNFFEKHLKQAIFPYR